MLNEKLNGSANTGMPMSTDTSPSSRMRARTLPPRLPMMRSRPNSGARAYISAATPRALAPLFHLDAGGIEYPIEDAAGDIAGRFQHQRLIEAHAGVAIGEGAK